MKTFSVKQLAELLDTNPETVRRWIRDKKLNAVQISRKDGNVVTEDELQRFLKATPKYMPRYTASMMKLNPAISIPLLLGSLLGGKVAGYLDEKKQLDVRVRPEDVEKYLQENITLHRENIKRRKLAIRKLENEIITEEEKLNQFQYLLAHKEQIFESKTEDHKGEE